MVAHRFVLVLKDQLRRSIDTEKLWFFGHINLALVRDGDVCAYLAKEGYEMRDGARCLSRIVENTIEAELFRKVRAKPEPFKDEDSQSPVEHYVVELHRDKENDVLAGFQCLGDKDDHLCKGKHEAIESSSGE